MASDHYSTQAARQRINTLIFLGPVCALLLLFFIAPVIINIGIAFTDMGRNLQVTELTTENF